MVTCAAQGLVHRPSPLPALVTSVKPHDSTANRRNYTGIRYLASQTARTHAPMAPKLREKACTKGLCCTARRHSVANVVWARGPVPCESAQGARRVARPHMALHSHAPGKHSRHLKTAMDPQPAAASPIRTSSPRMLTVKTASASGTPAVNSNTWPPGKRRGGAPGRGGMMNAAGMCVNGIFTEAGKVGLAQLCRVVLLLLHCQCCCCCASCCCFRCSNNA